MKPLKPLILLLSCFIIACTSSKITVQKPQVITASFAKKNKRLTAKEWQNWHHKDLVNDTIFGVSLDKVYSELLNYKKGDTITVALVDGRIDVSHEDIKQSLWVNKNEIPNNNIDDDNNGYVDDIHGWNFLGNSKGEQLYRASFEYTRVLRKYESLFKNKNEFEIPNKQKEAYQSYVRAVKTYNKRLEITKDNIHYLDSLIMQERKITKEFNKLYPNILLNERTLDSITKKNSKHKEKLLDFKSLIKNNAWRKNRLKAEKRYYTIYLNKVDNDREVIGDDSSSLNDIKYGNGNIGVDTSEARHTHGIKMIGVLAANRDNTKGINGITNLVKVMPLAVAPYGDCHDKDIALAIKYAVDNGAKIINMSIGKSFSLHNNWIIKAIKYAEEKDVLIITSSGNDNLNLDINFNYPNDAVNHTNEFVNNFIKVGGSTHKVDENVTYTYSNYGKNEVDIFAPAAYIYTTFNDNKYKYDSGTSLSCIIVSGIAALIRSHYPNLKASEVKQIIMESGVSLDIMVNKPSEKEEKELVPFSSLSKSGKIVNAYNALLLAEEISKKKKKRN
ncbi:MAG: S8 family serine peptidase [Kordia sp.]|uniref:S8 family serine peptidase n=1 Tax=Kordia sp. TaxID=1965332 RepID=UPI00385C9F5C